MNANTPHPSRFRRTGGSSNRRRFVAATTAALMLAGSAVALADAAEGDIAAGGGSANVVTGEAIDLTVNLYLKRTGNAAENVVWNLQATSGSCSSVTIGSITPASHTMPSSWKDSGQTGHLSKDAPYHVNSTVALGGAAGPAGQSCVITFQGTSRTNGALSGGNRDVTVTLSFVSASNTAPTVPGVPALSAGSTPNNSGAFTLSWATSTDPEGDAVTYTLEHESADGVAELVASGLTTASYTFGDANPAESEGTWTYRVAASDASLSSVSSGWSDPVVVDLTAPYAPTATATSLPDHDDGTNDWWKGSVTVGFTDNGDPDLADGSPGSGVRASTLGTDVTFNTTGPHTASDTVEDVAGNESPAGTLTVHVDATDPTAEFTNCPGFVQFRSVASADWAADDIGSGLATAPTGSNALDTSSVGSRTVYGPAPEDHVGNIGSAPACTYSVVYSSTGILPPINADGSSVFKINSTVPVKTRLTGDSAGYANGSFTIKLAKLTGTVYGDDNEPIVSTSAHTGTTLRYDASSDQYIFNLGTKALSAGTYRVTVELDDGSTRTATFGLRK